MLKKKTQTIKDNYVYIEEEVKCGECGEGTLIGEIAMINLDKSGRAKSVMAKTDCFFLVLNQEAFEILVKDKLKKERDLLGMFIYNAIPKMKEQFSFTKVVKNAHLIFLKEHFIRNQEIIKKGNKCEKLYIIKEGQCAIYVNIEVPDLFGVKKMKNEKIMDIGEGELFGEDLICFNVENQYTVKAISTQVTCLVITYSQLMKEYRRLISGLIEFFEQRYRYLT
mmetsp:Transcript_6793/g.6027  ORF Transcript_6793/g.6027 Transcript_6793/m.6027 type:complete len:223 (+) Transcript_6793:104-772(+)|eukprot:CAMPEP_0170567736 /NCGR_PEP_ID=MMETSP0211-20121228/80676_1 /TAXON_ID=311385 /ORGANISM="Pseudokeronopsis sp., Strain OXSARD2" /LENGTH=222 /DNA_ID=CAMNT_0010889289 /DNA_START=749 /DNA_END=1417 /DNA_ORIENTATION=-